MNLRTAGLGALALGLISTALLSPSDAAAKATSAVVVDPDAYSCAEPGYITFEDLADHGDLSSTTIKGVQFATTDGSPWAVGDFASGNYNGKYPNGSYTSQGSHWAWLGEEQGAGRITFANGPASTFSLLVSAGQTPIVLEGYDEAGTLLETAGPADPNIDSGTMTELKIDRDTDDLAYVVVHDSGNFFLVDSICTDAPGVARTSLSYVALGDSYSSGEGVKPFFEKKDDCDRSTKAYSTKITVPFTNDVWYKKRKAKGFAWGFLACSGATSPEILKKQVTKPKKGKNTNFVKLGKSTRLVTLTAGGNDAEFVDIVTFCAVNHTSCQNDVYKSKLTISAWLEKKLPAVQSDLVKLYQQIRVKAPNARIVVLGYPQLFPATNDEQNCRTLKQRSITIKKKTYSVLFSHAEQNLLRASGSRLNGVVDAAVAEANVGATFVPVDGVFAGHEPCGSDGEWVNGPDVDVAKRSVSKSSFHPNATGQATYAQIVNAVLTAPPTPDGRAARQGRTAGTVTGR